jgi:site-specific DNA-methyltransferase (adenine-specific)/adenine-specific DNA-methyltransferase
VVGKEGETLDRHDRWLCMMYPRLVLLKQFLREDGAIFVSIDDNEVGFLRVLLDEIFGRDNFIANIIWQKKYTIANDAKWLAENHDHILLYSRRKETWRPSRLARSEEMDRRYRNPDNHPKGPWKATPLYAKRTPSDAERAFSFTFKNGYVWKPPAGTTPRFPKEALREMDANDEIWFGAKGDAAPSRKTFLQELKIQSPPAATIWAHSDAGHNHEARDEIKALIGADSFDTPKPTRLIQRILQIATDKDALVLDSFAGSGTTGHAVLKQNAEDSGNRRFILVEMDDNIARNVTAERVKRVATGYTNAKGQTVEGLGGGFQYCRLSEEPLFDADGQIRRDVTFAQLAEFVWFAETGTGFPHPNPLPEGEGARKWSPLLGVHEGRAIYLLYNGILKDRSVAGGNVLTGPVFDVLPKFAGPKVIYAAANRMGARAAREGISFKQTPYALAV